MLNYKEGILNCTCKVMSTYRQVSQGCLAHPMTQVLNKAEWVSESHNLKSNHRGIQPVLNEISGE